MSKKAKLLAKEKRLQKKRAIKAANKAKYLAWKQAGENTKSYRNRQKSKKNAKSYKGLHPFFCGNLACAKCFIVSEIFVSKRKGFLKN